MSLKTILESIIHDSAYSIAGLSNFNAARNHIAWAICYAGIPPPVAVLEVDAGARAPPVGQLCSTGFDGGYRIV